MDKVKDGVFGGWWGCGHAFLSPYSNAGPLGLCWLSKLAGQAGGEAYLRLLASWGEAYPTHTPTKPSAGPHPPPGAMMDVSLVNDGPVTFSIDSDVDGPQAQLQ